MKLKVVFYDTEHRVCSTSRQSIARNFREYMDVTPSSGFSDCDFTPHPNRYIPLVFSGAKDKNGRELWEGHIVNFKMIDDSPTILTGEVGFEAEYAWFGVKFNEGGNVVFMPLFGIDPTKIEITGHKYNGFDEKYLATVKYG